MGVNVLMIPIIEVDADRFYSEFAIRKPTLARTECVLLRDKEHYRNNCSHLFMAADYSAGAALEYDGRIISVFSDKKHPGIGSELVKEAIKHGGNKLECNFMKGLLIGVYFRIGFIPVVKAPLDKNDVYWSDLNDEKKYPKSEGNNATEIMFCIHDQKLFKNPSTQAVHLENVIDFDSEKIAEAVRDIILENPFVYRKYINSIVGLELIV